MGIQIPKMEKIMEESVQWIAFGVSIGGIYLLFCAVVDNRKRIKQLEEDKKGEDNE